MTKSKLVDTVCEQYPDLPPAQIEALVTVFFETIQAALVRGDKVEIRGFGSFRVRHRAPRLSRNPKTGEAVSVPAKVVPFFKAGRDLKQVVDQGV